MCMVLVAVSWVLCKWPMHFSSYTQGCWTLGGLGEASRPWALGEAKALSALRWGFQHPRTSTYKSFLLICTGCVIKGIFSSCRSSVGSAQNSRPRTGRRAASAWSVSWKSPWSLQVLARRLPLSSNRMQRWVSLVPGPGMDAGDTSVEF